MDKPGDFFVGIIDFFGILVPGAILLYLDRDILTPYVVLPGITDSTVRWLVFAVGSYVLGHFVLAASVALNGLHSVYLTEQKDSFYNEVKDKISVPTKKKTRSDVFYRAYAYVRLKSPSAVAESERQMAEYKMFRSLTVVFALDFVISLFANRTPARVAISFFLSLAAAWRFVYLLNWTRRITFEYYALLHSDLPEKKEDKKHCETAGS